MIVKWRVLEMESPEDDARVVVQMSIDHGDGWRIVVPRMVLEVGEYQMIGAGLGLGLPKIDNNFRLIHENEVFMAWARRNG